MITPEPRLSDRRSRDPNRSSSPKKYRKNGSSANGELPRRTTWSDEMFATPFTAWPATRVKSGPPPAVVATAPGTRWASLSGGALAARESAAVRIRPVTTSPAMKPAITKTNERTKRRTISRNVDAACASLVRLWNRHAEDAVFQIRGDAVDVDRLRQREGALEAAVSAFDAMELLARKVASGSGGACAADDDAAVFGVNLDLIAREAGQFRGEHERRRRFVEIDRRRPAGCIGADELTDLFMQREQIAKRIPSGERHDSHRSTINWRRATCATIARIYSHGFFHPSDAASERDADQARERLVPHHGPAPSHAGQQARAHPGAHAQHPHAGAGGSQVPRGRRRRARGAGRARDAVPLQRRRSLLLHGHVHVRADSHLDRGARRLEGLPHRGLDHPGRVLRRRAGRHRAAADGGSRREGNRTRHQGQIGRAHV